MSPEQRAITYQQIWHGQECPLKAFQRPPICSKFPHWADEIFAAYVDHVTFTVRVWANYDSCTKQYFSSDQARVEDCGKLVLSPKQRARLESFGDTLELKKIRLDIGTPFRTLLQLYITVSCSREDQLPDDDDEDTREPSKPYGSTMEKVISFVDELVDIGDGNTVQEHRILRYLVDQLAERIPYTELEQWGGTHGLNLRDLDDIAKGLRFEPEDVGQRRQWFED